MNNEETRLINDEPINTQTPVNSAPEKKSSKGKAVAAAAGGFVTGAVVGGATGVMASNGDLAVSNEEVDHQEENRIPEPEDVILANNEGIRFAHVEADSFEDAFAQAREQVGPGGAFEYNGKIYATYYDDEWNNMSSQERADFQSRVNDVVPAHHSTPIHQDVHVHVVEHHEIVTDHIVAESEVAHNAQLVSEEPVNNEVRVLGVEAVQNDDGSIMNVALLENGGDHALMVDVDNDGMIEVFVHDDNFDGQIQDNEVHDIADAGIHVNDLLAAQAAQEGDYLAASDDGMPDYINDADSVMEV